MTKNNKDFYTLLEEIDPVQNIQYLKRVLDALRAKGIAGIFSANAIAGAPQRKRMREIFKALDGLD